MTRSSQEASPTSQTHQFPNGLRYRLGSIAVGTVLNIVLGLAFGVINVVFNPQDVPLAQKLNAFGYGIGFAIYLAPFGALGRWASAEASLPIIRKLHGKASKYYRFQVASVLTLMALLVSLFMFFVIGGLTLIYYPVLVVVVFLAAWLGSPMLNRSARVA